MADHCYMGEEVIYFFCFKVYTFMRPKIMHMARSRKGNVLVRDIDIAVVSCPDPRKRQEKFSLVGRLSGWGSYHI